MATTWPQSLLDPAVYPHPVSTPSLIETHISWVILTGSFAYKLRKPVDLGFLDFTTLELRHRDCLRELDLNRRYSPSLYLSVVPVTGPSTAPRIDGTGEIIDYAVKMRQFDNAMLADNLAKHDQLTPALVAQLARTLAHFHTTFPAAAAAAAGAARAHFADAALQNFCQIDAYPLPGPLRDTLQQLEAWTISSLRSCQEQMEQRQQRGFIKDCHGDCHLGNIAVIDGEVALFDCIEFNDDFRVMDTIAEAAFLAMDLCARGLNEHAWRFLNDYLAYRGDYEGLALLNLYQCYYALVRAKVTLMRTPLAETPSISATSHPEVAHYIDLAQGFTRKQPPLMILMHGFSGSGKSWLAEHLSVLVGAVRIRSDVERKRLFGLLPEQSGATIPDLYTREASRKTFARLLELCAAVTDAGFTCIVDATFLHRSTRGPFIEWAQAHRVPWLIVDCQARENTIIERLQQRAADRHDPSDADATVYRQQTQNADSFTDEEQQRRITIDTEQTDCVATAVERLRRQQGFNGT